jgi:hypothetical protein
VERVRRLSCIASEPISRASEKLARDLTIIADAKATGRAAAWIRGPGMSDTPLVSFDARSQLQPHSHSVRRHHHRRRCRRHRRRATARGPWRIGLAAGSLLASWRPRVHAGSRRLPARPRLRVASLGRPQRMGRHRRGIGLPGRPGRSAMGEGAPFHCRGRGSPGGNAEGIRRLGGAAPHRRGWQRPGQRCP